MLRANRPTARRSNINVIIVLIEKTNLIENNEIDFSVCSSRKVIIVHDQHSVIKNDLMI